MGITIRNVTSNGGESSSSFESIGTNLQSFGKFCALELLKQKTLAEHSIGNANDWDTINQLQQYIENAADAYINGEEMDGPVNTLFEGMLAINSRRIEINISSSKKFPFKRTDFEMFYTDLLSCMEDILLHKYVSDSWGSIDYLIRLNRKKSRTIDIDGTFTVPKTDRNKSHIENIIADTVHNEDKVALDKWNKIREAYFHNHIYNSVVDTTNEEKESHESTLCNKKRRRPTVYFLGGGMGAGKSTVVSYLKETNDEIFQHNPVIVEADAFKHLDPIFRAANAFQEKNELLLQSIHEISTDAANLQLVKALSDQRDVVVDGTMTWMPYVQQTIAMVRDAHRYKYRLGPGYSKDKEVYWERAGCIDHCIGSQQPPLPYRVEMVGVTADPGHAVSRGIRRAIITGRVVPVHGQLRSHRLYSQHFPVYAGVANKNNDVSRESACLFDRIRLYNTSASANSINIASDFLRNERNNSDATLCCTHNDGSVGNISAKDPKRHRKPPNCIAWKASPDQPLSVVPDAYERFLGYKFINDDATSASNLYSTSNIEPQEQNPTRIDTSIPMRLRETFATIGRID